MTSPPQQPPSAIRPGATPGVAEQGPGVGLPGTLLGIGLGGLVDGIVLHQILQWHHMISHEEPVDTVLGLERNTLADGIFHAGAWIAVLVGLILLWSRLGRRATAPPLQALVGWLLFGWGLFDVVEGLVNHHLLGLHHVRDDIGSPLGWDLAFLAFGAILIAAGWLLQRRATARTASTASRATRSAAG